MTDNLRIWRQVEKSDPKMTKTSTQGGRTETSVNGVYMAKLATEALGPAGECWGYEIQEERFDNTVPAVLSPGSNGNPPVFMMDGDRIVWEQVHTVILRLWHGSKENFVVQAGHTPYRYMTKRGIFCDKEYLKKSITDAMKKCLTLLGVCSDIYMGMYDDQNYQAAAAMESDLKRADDQDKAAMDRVEEIRAGVDDAVNAMRMCPNWTAAEKVYTLAINKAQRLCPVVGLSFDDERKPLDAVYFEIKAKFEQGGN